MMTVFATLSGFAKRIPWPVWAALAIIAAWGLDRTAQHREGVREGKETILAELRIQEADALKKAAQARAVGDEAAAKREADFAEQQARTIDTIEEAEANETNALDALLGG